MNRVQSLASAIFVFAVLTRQLEPSGFSQIRLQCPSLKECRVEHVRNDVVVQSRLISQVSAQKVVRAFLSKTPSVSQKSNAPVSLVPLEWSVSDGKKKSEGSFNETKEKNSNLLSPVLDLEAGLLDLLEKEK